MAAEAVCEGCGAEREAGRSVCASCGLLATPTPTATPPPPTPTPPARGPYAPPGSPPGAPSAGPGPYAPPGPYAGPPPMAGPQPQAWAGPSYGAAPYGAWVSPQPAPTRPARRKGRSPVALLLAIALGIGAYVVARNVTYDALSSRADRAEAHTPSSDDAEAADASAAVPVERVEVSSENLHWTMRADPVKTPLDAPAGDGTTMHGEAMASDVGTLGAQSADLVILYELEGRTVDLDGGLRGAVSGNGGEVLEGPNPVTMGGQPGRMVTASFERGGVSGIVRYAIARFGDRLLVVGVVDEGTDRSVGQQTFADMVASVRAD